MQTASELLEEAEIAAVTDADGHRSVADHAEALDTKAGGETRLPAFRIQAHSASEQRLDRTHAATHHFEPTAAPAIHSAERFQVKGKLAGPEAQPADPRELLAKKWCGAAQMAEIQTFLNREHLHLWNTGEWCIHRIAPEDPAGATIARGGAVLSRWRI